MKKIKIVALLSSVLCLGVSFSASAVPVHATFSGQVNGSEGLSPIVLTDFPNGTSASFDVTFEDALPSPDAPPSLSTTSVSGTVNLGGYQWTLNGGHVSSYSFFFSPFSVISYQLQLTGTGPTIPTGGSLFGLFLSLTPDLHLAASTVPMVGFAYPVSSGEYYSYAKLTGNFSATKATSVPEPVTALLMLPAAVLFFGTRRRKR